jgi:predicted AAA+ superfamily ATPase
MDRERLIYYISEKITETRNLSQKNEVLHNNKRKFYYNLKKHVDEFLLGYGENRFVTLAGLRGIGKTTALFQIYDYLRNEKEISSKKIIYIPVDELEYLGINLYDAINIFIEEFHETSLVNLKEKIFLLIDEAQQDKNWSKVGKIIYDKTDKVFMIFTGSSALNFEMNVDAVRRIKKEQAFPMSFNEYNLLKNKISPPRDYENTIMNLILNGNNLKEAISKEHEMQMDLLNLNTSIKKEWEKYLLFKDFPFGLNMKNKEISMRIFEMINRIIEKDVFALKSFNTNSITTIMQIITYIGLQEPGGTSDSKLATILSKSAKSIREILDVLEKTHLLFALKPYGTGSKQIRKSWKYYFLSPSINASIRDKFGKFSPKTREFMGLLAENLIASYLFKIKQTKNQFLNIYYDPSKNGVDFLLDTYDNIIPIEVGIGKKDKKQILKAINRYKSEYGIIISNTTEKIRKEDNIIYIPLVSIS